MYPMLNEGVEIGTFTYEGSEIEHYYARNPDGDEFEISAQIADELARADGTRELKLRRRIIEELKDNGLIHTTRFVKDGNFTRLILFPIGSRARKYRNVCLLLNSVLPIISILIFMGGVFFKLEDISYRGYDFDIFVYYGLLVVSLLLHECGHLIAGLSYGYDISELGILLLWIIPIGAYIAYQDKKDVHKCNRIQFSLAGIEMNLLLAGLCLLGSVASNSLTMTLTLIANLNVALAIVNLLPAQGLDGENAISHALGVDSINAMARKWILKRRYRKRLLQSGYKGYVCMCLFVFLIISDGVVWLLVGADVLYTICYCLFN